MSVALEILSKSFQRKQCTTTSDDLDRFIIFYMLGLTIFWNHITASDNVRHVYSRKDLCIDVLGEIEQLLRWRTHSNSSRSGLVPISRRTSVQSVSASQHIR